MSENNKDNNNKELPAFYYIIIDGNQTERGKKLRAKMEKLGYDEESIENEVQVDHALSFLDGDNICFKSYFEFNFRQVELFVQNLLNRGIPMLNVIDYLEGLKKANLQRGYRYITDEEIEEKNIPPERIVGEDEIKLFNRSIKVEIKYLKKKFKAKGARLSKKTNRLVWLGSEQQLINLLTLLYENDYIHNLEQIEAFMANFEDVNHKPFSDKDNQAIIWYSKQNELTFLLLELTKHDINLLDEIELWKKTKSIFVNKDGKPFISLAVSSQKTPKNSHLLTKIINKVK